MGGGYYGDLDRQRPVDMRGGLLIHNVIDCCRLWLVSSSKHSLVYAIFTWDFRIKMASESLGVDDYLRKLVEEVSILLYQAFPGIVGVF